MPKTKVRMNHLQTNFSSGQVDPRMKGRRDGHSGLTMYQNGAASLLNSSPQVTGGARRRPGTIYLATLGEHTRLERLQFNETQLYIFAFQNAKVLIYDETGALLQTLSTQPWDATTMWEMTLATNGDTTIITHKDFPMRKLLRTGASTFTSTVFAFETFSTGFPVYEPYFKFADTAITLTPSATTGSITLTTSDDHWTTDHVGSLVRYVEKTCTVASYVSATVVNATVNETLTATVADEDWDENVFSAANGYVRSAAFHSRRLWFGGSRDLSRHAFASRKGAPFNFDVGTGLDDESIQAEVVVDQIGEIRHSHSGRHLQFICDTGVVFVPETDTSPVSPSTFNPRFQIPFGALNTVDPKRLDGAEIFIQDTGKVVRELIFNDLQQAYTGDAISLVSNDLINDVQDCAVLYGHSDGPEQFALIVNGDGTIACYHSIRSEKIAGWLPWATPGASGLFESVTGLNNELFASVKRTINGNTVYMLERFDFDVTVDCAKHFDAASTDTFVVAHLPMTAVFGVSDDGAISLGEKTTNISGSVTFDNEATELYVGLNYTRTIITLPPIIQTSKGEMSGELMRIGDVVLEVDESISFSVNGYDFIVRQAGDDLSLPPSKVDGKHRFNLLGWSRAPQITITQDDPLDFTLLSIWMEVWT